MRSKSVRNIVLSVIIGLIGIYAVSVLANIKILWGINIIKFLPVWWQWVGILLPALFIIPMISDSAVKILSGISSRLNKNHKTEIAFIAVISLVSVFLFVIFRSKSNLLGDSLLRLNQIYFGKLWLPTEAGDFLLHSIIYKLFLASKGITSEAAYWIVSPICGVIFIFGIYRLSKYLNESNWLLFFLIQAVSGIAVMFYGYMESYAIIACLLPFVVLTGFKAIETNGNKFKFVILYIISGVFHPIGFVIFGGLLYGVIISGTEYANKSKPKVVKHIIYISVIGLTGLYILRYLGVPHISRYLMPVIASENQPFGFITKMHFFNLINWFFLAALTSIPILAAVMIKGESKEKNFKNWEYMAGSLLLVPPALFILFFIPHLNGPRDWDLFSLPVFLFVPAGLLLCRSIFMKRVPSQILALVMVGAFTSVSFAVVNNTKPLAADRFVEVIETTKVKNLYIEYSLLYDQASKDAGLVNKCLHYALKAWQQPPYKKEDSVYMADQLATIFIGMGDKGKARFFTEMAIFADSQNVTGYLTKSEYIKKFETPEALYEFSAQMEKIFENDALGRMNTGVNFIKLGEVERGGENLEAAYLLDSNDTRIIANYCAALYHTRRFQRCIDILERDLYYTESIFQRYYFLSRSYLALNNREKAIENFKKARPFAVQSNELRVFNGLKNDLGL